VPRHGVPRGSVLGPSIVNCVLDGLEKVVNEVLKLSKYFKSWLPRKNEKFVEKYIVNSTKHFKVPARSFFLRVAGDILVLGESNSVAFNAAFQVLAKKLKEKGLSPKDIGKPILEFKPETYFDYLGFRFFCESYHKESLFLGRFTFKNYNNSLWVSHQKIRVKSNSGLVVSIQPESFRDCCIRIREIFAKPNAGLSVDELLRRYNYIIQSIVHYFGITFNTRNHLRYLDNLGYCWFRQLLLQKHRSANKV
jgi:Group II intron, maturase-specific domain